MKTLKILVFALFLLGGAYVAWSWHLSTHNAKWLWCENYEGIRTGKGEEGAFGGFRMHMCPKADSLWMVSGSSQGFAHIDSCFAFLQSHPWCRVWIVADSLDARNFDSFLYSVIGSATRHEVEPARIVVETEGICDRIVRLTPNSSDLGDCYVTDDGETLYYLSAFEGGTATFHPLGAAERQRGHPHPPYCQQRTGEHTHCQPCLVPLFPRSVERAGCRVSGVRAHPFCLQHDARPHVARDAEGQSGDRHAHLLHR